MNIKQDVINALRIEDENEEKNLSDIIDSAVQRMDWLIEGVEHEPLLALYSNMANNLAAQIGTAIVLAIREARDEIQTED
jgi:hypothetical protein